MRLFKVRYKVRIENERKPGEKVHVQVVAKNRVAAYDCVAAWLRKNLNRASKNVFISTIEPQGLVWGFYRSGVLES